jgi:hypothetical protein
MNHYFQTIAKIIFNQKRFLLQREHQQTVNVNHSERKCQNMTVLL